MTTPAADGPVWRDRGAIIAQQQTRIAEMEAEQAELAALRGQVEALADGLCECGDESCVESAWLMALRAVLAVAPAEDTTPAEPHAEDGADAGACSNNEHACSCGDWDGPACDWAALRPAPVADPSGDTEGGQA